MVKPFSFDDVASTFEVYVREQLPWYDLATDLVIQVAQHYISESSKVYDLGASTGNIGRALFPILDERGAQLISVEKNPEMRRKWDGPGVLIPEDITLLGYETFSFAVSFLTLMFVPVSERGQLLEELKEACDEGGAIMFVEKELAPGGYPGTIMRRLTLAAKQEAGVSAQDIIDKELALAGVQRPVENLPGVELFRFGEFVGKLWEPGGDAEQT